MKLVCKTLTWIVLLGVAAGVSACRGVDTETSTQGPSPEATGTVDGGGGKGVLCTDPVGTKALYVLDLYESENVRGEKPDLSFEGMDVREQFISFTLKAGQALRDPAAVVVSDPRSEMSIVYDEFLKQMKPARRALLSTPDATVPQLPSHCKEVQIAIWRTNGNIDVDLDLWEMLSTRHQAALALHEYLYFHERTYGAHSSDESRWFVGRVFSDLLMEGRFPNAMFQPGAKVLWCHGGGGAAPYSGPTFEIYAQEETENSVSGVAFYLHYTLSKDVYFNALSKLRSFEPGMTINELVMGKRWPSELQFQNPFKADIWKFDSFEDHPAGPGAVARVSRSPGESARSSFACSLQ